MCHRIGKRGVIGLQLKILRWIYDSVDKIEVKDDRIVKIRRKDWILLGYSCQHSMLLAGLWQQYHIPWFL